MKIAVACDEEGKVAVHFGRSAGFKVFEFSGTKLAGQEDRSNPHDQDQETHGHHGGHGGLLKTLDGCEAMLCGGMGGRAAMDLQRAGIKPFVISGFSVPEDAAMAYAEGKVIQSGPFHRCCQE